MFADREHESNGAVDTTKDITQQTDDTRFTTPADKERYEI